MNPKRLQVVVSEAEHDEIRSAAERDRTTVSAWVRRALRQARAAGRRGKYADPEGRVQVAVSAGALEAVRARHGFLDRAAAAEYAVRRTAVAPMTKAEALDMQGVGWEGSVARMRAGRGSSDQGADEFRDLWIGAAE